MKHFCLQSLHSVEAAPRSIIEPGLRQEPPLLLLTPSPPHSFLETQLCWHLLPGKPQVTHWPSIHVNPHIAARFWDQMFRAVSADHTGSGWSNSPLSFLSLTQASWGQGPPLLHFGILSAVPEPKPTPMLPRPAELHRGPRRESP